MSGYFSGNCQPGQIVTISGDGAFWQAPMPSLTAVKLLVLMAILVTRLLVSRVHGEREMGNGKGKVKTPRNLYLLWFSHFSWITTLSVYLWLISRVLKSSFWLFLPVSTIFAISNRWIMKEYQLIFFLTKWLFYCYNTQQIQKVPLAKT